MDSAYHGKSFVIATRAASAAARSSASSERASCLSTSASRESALSKAERLRPNASWSAAKLTCSTLWPGCRDGGAGEVEGRGGHRGVAKGRPHPCLRGPQRWLTNKKDQRVPRCAVNLVRARGRGAAHRVSVSAPARGMEMGRLGRRVHACDCVRIRNRKHDDTC